MYRARNLIFVSSLYLILVGSLVHSIPASSSDDDISPVYPALFEKRWDCDKCPVKTVTDFCTITKTTTDTCTITKTTTDTCTITKKETDTCTITKKETDIYTTTKKETDTCTITKKETVTCTTTQKETATTTKTETSAIKYPPVTVTCTETVTKYNTETDVVTHENEITDTVTNKKTQTDTVVSEKIKTVTSIETKSITLPPSTVTDTVTKTETDTKTVLNTITKTETDTKTVSDTVTKTVTATTTVLPCNKPVKDTPCDSPMFSFVSPQSGSVLKRNENFQVKYNITKLPGEQSGFLKDLQFYLVSSDLSCVNQTIAKNADTTPTRVCNKSLQYTILAHPKGPPGYYAIQAMYNFCNTTSGKNVCVFHDCKRGVEVK